MIPAAGGWLSVVGHAYEERVELGEGLDQVVLVEHDLADGLVGLGGFVEGASDEVYAALEHLGA